ncbi:MAG: sulfotransferase family 2 domain-containing protein [Bauldia sp.]|nr:sulfotransferase family 2 domain-containing protein [Bauldia sp.]
MKRSFAAYLQQHNQRSKSDCFLHIPKTGGSGVGRFLAGIAKEVEGARVPIRLSHAWTAKKILKFHPEIKIHFLIRDPIERLVSAFQTRLREGAPGLGPAWRVGEAAAFAFFSDPSQWMLALISDDNRLKSAAYFTLQNVRLLRLNYVHFFESPEYLATIRDNLGVVTPIERTGEFLDAMCHISGVDPTMIERHYSQFRVSKVRSADFVEQLTDKERQRLMQVFQPDYAIYDYLQAYAQTALSPSPRQ